MALSDHLNGLLRRLSPESAEAVMREMSRVHLPLGFEIHRPGEPMDALYFMESGITSLVHVVDGEQAEVGMIGREGAVGSSVALGIRQSPHRAQVQIPGFGLRIEAAAFLDLVERFPALGEVVRHSLLVLLLQVSETAYCNARAFADRRLARWLLMCHDRADGPNIPLTHEYLATMLGTGRGAVTLSMHRLEGDNLIKATRGNVRILDRNGLLGLAGGIYTPAGSLN
jgi:CRP-like cAMP-binding protein